MGVSDHATIIFDFVCTYKEIQSNAAKLQYEKCDIKGFEDEWEEIHSEINFENLQIDDMWKVFKN